ncbi:hypothetical protein CO046_03060 [Candidatus Peregrinibacteria bacterium CG_4_9_14_0_2_um_filter_53_11]|nr:MAG: hypothetical protein CO046_03060 [Candidatus Peregrinibacteria bacterium CG_4_9_14_0_2_um_filter_53_11]
MRVGVDTQALNGAFTGHRIYLDGLMKGFEELYKLNTRELNLNEQREGANGNHQLIRLNLVSHELRTARRILHDQIQLPWAAWRSKLDLLFVPAFSVPLLYPGKIVATVHDLTALDYPENFPAVSRFYWTRLVPYSLRRADRLIAISQYTKDWVVERLGIDPEKIDVVHSACDQRYFRTVSSQEQKEACTRNNLPEEFVMMVGTIEKKRNHETLIRAYSQLKDAPPLLLVGKKAHAWPALEELIHELKLEDRLLVRSEISSKDLPALYQRAALTVVPSLSEGFGLPVLESMASGTPVVVAKSTALPEIAGSAALFFDPHAPEELADQMAKLLHDSALREKLSQLGKTRATEFTWLRTAQQTSAVFSSITTI